jgi:alkylation response protein AidB-like acyl-CoA dehydrogenase
MTYKIDEKDVEFNLFEWLQIGTKLPLMDAYKEHGEDLYKMIIGEGLKFAKNELDPINMSGDREGCTLENGQVKAPKGFKEAYRKFAENGFIGIDTPATYGGQGLPIMLGTVMYEFFSAANVPFAMYAGLTRGGAHMIETFCDEKLGKLFCAKMYDGTWAGTMCLTEPGAGSAVGDLKTTAKPLPDGSYQITGNKIFISSGDHDLTENIVHTVLARVEGDAPGTKGISLFVVPKYWVNPDGSVGESNDVSCVNIEHKMGIKASSTCSLNFGEKGKCRGWLVGERSKGMRYMFQMMNEARLLCGVQGQSVAGTAYLNALDYARERTQGGNSLILGFPDVRRNLSFCKAFAEGMRALIYYTAFQIDLAARSKDAAEKERAQNRADLLTPICKAYCSDTGFKVTELAMQVYGGYGYCDEYPAEQYMRDVKISSIYEGTNGIQALDLIGRKLAQKQGQLFRELYEEVTDFVGKNENHATLKAEMAALKGSIDTVGQVAMTFAEWGMGGDQVSPMLSATPFLEMCGDTIVAWLLLDQAVLAEQKVKAGQNDAFYRNKARTARFFATHVLPRVRMQAKAILAKDKTAMEIEF